MTKAGIDICPMNPFEFSINKVYSITLHLLCSSYTLEQSKDVLCVCRWGRIRQAAVLTPVPYKWIAMLMVTYLPLYVNPREGVLDE